MDSGRGLSARKNQEAVLLAIDFDGTLTSEALQVKIKEIVAQCKGRNDVKIGIVTARSVYDDFDFHSHQYSQFTADIQNKLVENDLSLDFISTAYALYILDKSKPTVKEAIEYARVLPTYGDEKDEANISDYLAYRRDNREPIKTIQKYAYPDKDVSEARNSTEGAYFPLKQKMQSVTGDYNNKDDDNGKETKIRNNFKLLARDANNKAKKYVILKPNGKDIESFKPLQIHALVEYFKRAGIAIKRVLLVDDSRKQVDAVNHCGEANWKAVQYSPNKIAETEKAMQELVVNAPSKDSDMIEVLDASESAQQPEALKLGYRIVVSREVMQGLLAYKAALANGEKTPGPRLAVLIKDKNISQLSDEEFLELVVQTKKPREFAEYIASNETVEWNTDELTILGNINIAVNDVEIYDNGVWIGNAIKSHATPFKGTLLFTPGAVLANINGKSLPDFHEVVNPNGSINDEAYYQLYKRRLLPLLIHANEKAKQNSKKAFITITGIGCGAFAGDFNGQLGDKFAKVLDRLLQENGKQLSNIQALYYDPFKDNVILNKSYSNGRRKIHGIDLMVRGDGVKPQLLQPEFYQEKSDDFKNCEFFSFVAWDHVSWPGNDFYQNNVRWTDDGVKAAATSAISHMTGIQGRYDSRDHKYYPPKEYGDWEKLIADKKLQIAVKGNVSVMDIPSVVKLAQTQTGQGLFDQSKANDSSQVGVGTDPLLQDVRNAITQLRKEINSCWPYPNKDRKHIKLHALDMIKRCLEYNEDLSACINDIETKFPDALKGKVSKRTLTIVSRCKEMLADPGHATEKTPLLGS